MKLRFGIPTLDHLLDLPDSEDTKTPDATSFAILGPDGSGKSLLALHLASQYVADWSTQLSTYRKKSSFLQPRTIYVSSDFKHESAQKVWSNFGLGRPYDRRIPSEGIAEAAQRLMLQPRTEISLEPLTPGERDEVKGHKPVPAFLLDPETSKRRVGFLDLVHYTAGDDWNFVNSLLVKLESLEPPSIDGKDLKHLVVIDSVAGFETFVGKLDAFGIEQTRRARIAQCLRNAGRHCHVVFVVEEPKADERLPEEYVTDVVIRLRARHGGSSSWRTVEVEKARARNHAIGEHVFEVREKWGSSTADWENADMPSMLSVSGQPASAYIHVFPSLSHRNRLTAASRGSGKPDVRPILCPFGLSYLDELLDSEPSAPASTILQKPRGLRSGTTTAVIGDPGTGKSALSEKWISEGFREVVEEALTIYALMTSRYRQNLKDTNLVETYLSRVYQKLQRSIIETQKTQEKETITEQCGNFEDWDPIFTKLRETWSDGETESEAELDSIKKQLSRDRYPSLESRRLALNIFLPRFPFNRKRARRQTNSPRSQFCCRVLSHSAFFEHFNSENSVKNRHVFIGELFRHPNLRSPAVLMTTSDRKASELARHCFEFLRTDFDSLWAQLVQSPSNGDREQCEKIILQIIEEQMFVRRFDIDTMPASVLFETVWRNLIAAEYQIHDAFFPPTSFPNVPRERALKGAKIRLVIDDLRALSNLCPSVTSDSAFLPYLVFALEREGVTTLLVHTDSLRPGEKPTEPLSQQLQSLLRQVILTWHVPCEGRNRVAISPLFGSSRTGGYVRELEVQQAQGYSSVDVTPRFDLYTDLEIGKPQPVPLAIYLYNATAACQKYIDQEDSLYRELFVPVKSSRNGEKDRIIWPLSAADYLHVKDSSTLPVDVKTDHTVIFQVESFWSEFVNRPALGSQRKYLLGKIDDANDPFEQYRDRPRNLAEGKSYKPRRQSYFYNSGYKSRLGHWEADVSDVDSTRDLPRRVPFMWDFSFLLLPSSVWETAGQARIEFRGKKKPQWWIDFAASREAKQDVTRQDQFEGEVIVKYVIQELQEDKRSRAVVPWRLFMGAAKAVADRVRKSTGVAPPVFDFASTNAESINSMFLEIWLSEIDLAVADLAKTTGYERWKILWRGWRQGLSANKYDPESRPLKLLDLLTGHATPKSNSPSPNSTGPISDAVWSLVKEHERLVEEPAEQDDSRLKELFSRIPLGAICLYKTWLLLLEVLDFESFTKSDAFEMSLPRDAAIETVAVRHFYRTACDLQAKSRAESAAAADSSWAVALPGRFCVRGDSFLASPNVSRSKLLASHAMDLLSSRRANLVRLQMGLGLPVRDVLSDEGCMQLRTALQAKIRDKISRNDAFDGIRRVNDNPSVKRGQYMYLEEGSWRRGTKAELTYDGLCAIGASPQEEAKLHSSLWLFRNSIADYGRASRVLQKWINRLFRWTATYKSQRQLGWEGGFTGYDALSVGNFREVLRYSSFLEFAEHCDFLVEELKASGMRTGTLSNGKSRSPALPDQS